MGNNSRSPPSITVASTSILPTFTTTNPEAEDTSSSRRRLGVLEWPTVDGPLGLSHEDALPYARRFFKLGFLFLPFLWAVNCFYFWPVLRNSSSHSSNPGLRRYLVGSAFGFVTFTIILSSWALTFAIGGERLFGHVWEELVMFNVADKYGLTGLV